MDRSKLSLGSWAFTFGPFSVTTETGRLTREGVEVKLRPRAFDSLRVLVRTSPSLAMWR